MIEAKTTATFVNYIKDRNEAELEKLIIKNKGVMPEGLDDDLKTEEVLWFSKFLRTVRVR